MIVADSSSAGATGSGCRGGAALICCVAGGAGGARASSATPMYGAADASAASARGRLEARACAGWTVAAGGNGDGDTSSEASRDAAIIVDPASNGASTIV